MKVRMNVDYKSIALPAELQGRIVIDASIRPKNYISQYKKSYLSCSALLRFAALVAQKRLDVTNLSVWESVWDLQSYLVWDFTSLHNFITTIKNGVEKHEGNQIYKTEFR